MSAPDNLRAPREAILAISEAFALSIGPDQVDRYAAILYRAAAAAREGSSRKEVETLLRSELDSAGIRLGGRRYGVLAEEITAARGDVHVTLQGVELDGVREAQS